MPRRLKAPQAPVLPATPLVRLSLLGGLRVERPDAPPITRFQPQKTVALLTYLALYPKRTHGREFLTSHMIVRVLSMQIGAPDESYLTAGKDLYDLAHQYGGA